MNEPRVRTNHAEIMKCLHDPSATFWFKDALRTALTRAPVDAANDAQVLYNLLSERADALAESAAIRARVNAGISKLRAAPVHTDSPWDDLKEP